MFARQGKTHQVAQQALNAIAVPDGLTIATQWVFRHKKTEASVSAEFRVRMLRRDNGFAKRVPKFRRSANLQCLGLKGLLPERMIPHNGGPLREIQHDIWIGVMRNAKEFGKSLGIRNKKFDLQSVARQSECARRLQSVVRAGQSMDGDHRQAVSLNLQCQMFGLQSMAVEWYRNGKGLLNELIRRTRSNGWRWHDFAKLGYVSPMPPQAAEHWKLACRIRLEKPTYIRIRRIAMGCL